MYGKIVCVLSHMPIVLPVPSVGTVLQSSVFSLEPFVAVAAGRVYAPVFPF